MNIVSSCCPEVCLYTHRLIQRSVLIRHKWHISVTALLPKALENVTEEGGKILRVVGCWGRLCYSVFWTTGRDCCTHKPQWQIKPVSLPARMKRALQGPTPKLRKGEAVPWPLQLQFNHMVTCNLQERTHLRTGPGARNSFQLPNFQQGHSQNCSLGSCPSWPLSISFSHYLMFLQVTEGPRGEMAQVTSVDKRVEGDVSPEWGRTLLLCQHM